MIKVGSSAPPKSPVISLSASCSTPDSAAAIYTTDAQGKITYFNQAAVELAGRAPTIGSDEWCVTWKLYNPDGTPLPYDRSPMAAALREGRAIRNAEVVSERPDG